VFTELCNRWGGTPGPRGSPWTRKNAARGSRADQGVRPTNLLLAILLAASLVHAKRLPIRTYTTADGLASDQVLCIHQDSHGFLWFCTAEGLSRFDGYSFTNYQTSDGLPGNVVRKLIETRQGIYWIATFDGVVRFDPRGAGKSRFRSYPLSTVRAAPKALSEDREGGIWCGTTNSQGVFYLGPRDAAFHHVDMPAVDPIVTALLIDRRGALWMGTAGGLFRRDPDGSVHAIETVEGLGNADIMAILEDRTGRLWVGTRAGLVLMGDGATPQRVYGVRDGLPSKRVESLLETSDGKLWVGTADGLALWTPADPRDGREFQAFTPAQGLNAKAVGAMAEDSDGNLWMATFGSGAMKMARNGFTTYTEADGAPFVQSFALSRRGELCALFREQGGARIGRFDGSKFVEVKPAWPRATTYFGWGRGQDLVQDAAGEWWISTGMGLCRFARADSVTGLAGASPKAVYTRRDGLPGDEIFTVFADSHGGIWIGTIGLQTQDGMALWDRDSGKIRAFSGADGLPPKPLPSAFAEDRAGNIWAALYHGGLARYRQGRFTVFGERDGVSGFIESLFVDSAGRLWVGTSSRGMIRIDNPAAERPQFAVYGIAQGLSSSAIIAFTEDRGGRLYAATGRGIDRFTPQPGGLSRVQRFTTADGIASGALDLAFRDAQDNLWFSTPLGVSQFVPADDRPRSPPPVLVTGLSAGGVAQAVSDLGQSTLTGLRFPQVPLRVDYVGLGFQPGGTLRYQYMLEGADTGWSAPTDQRTVIYASLAPGGYRFRVRALAADGATSLQPTLVQFTILPPVWRTWWFLMTCGTALALVAYALHRYRLAQLLAVANVRTRIATDLHDDIGASLSQIAVLSEVAQRGAGKDRNGAPLKEIAGISRELVDSMSDIVWAINPEHDRLSNLVYRMRRFATDLLGGQRIALQFRSSVADRDLRIGANVRRQIYLIFKEGIHNIARHSGALRVEIQLDRDGDFLILCMVDDGKGFDVAAESEGHGLPSIRKRAAALGAQVDWQSAPGQGTTLHMRVRLEPARSLSLLRGGKAGDFR
jgi:ligand-binding sensor domain-containing protein/signal transduction histidine kinase